MSRGLRFVDADGHILEHPSGMVDYAPQRWRDRIWHIETDAEGCEWCVVNGSRTRASGMSWRAWRAWAPRPGNAPAAARFQAYFIWALGKRP